MKWSWRVGTLSGIELRIHATFLLLPAWVAATRWADGSGFEAAVAAVGFVLALFACVALHEFGHALAARRFGIATRDITLLPIGGVARLERMPEKPAQELAVALAGPAVNVVIAAVLFLSLAALGTVPFLEQLLMANVGLVLFNLIPAFPMDGGRVLRALLASRMEYARATRIAARTGQVLAVGFAIAGLFGNPMLLVIAAFVWMSASQEAAFTQMKSAITGTPVAAAMLRDFRMLPSDASLSDAIRVMLDGSQQDFPVVEEGRVAGMLTRSRLLAALAEHGEQFPVAAVMDRQLRFAESGETLEAAFARLEEVDCRVMPVLENGRLVGLLTAGNLSAYFLVQAAQRRRRRPMPVPIVRRGTAPSMPLIRAAPACGGAPVGVHLWQGRHAPEEDRWEKAGIRSRSRRRSRRRQRARPMRRPLRRRARLRRPKPSAWRRGLTRSTCGPCRLSW